MIDFSDTLILTDLDGTFFGKKSSLVPRNMEAIERFKAAGGFFTVATGRHFSNIFKPIPGIRELVNAPIVCCNGALLYDVKSSEIISERFIPYEYGKKVVDYIIGHYPTGAIRASTPGGFLVDSEALERSEMLKHDVSTSTPGYYHVVPYDEWNCLGWYKLVVREEAEKIDPMREELEKIGFEGIQFSRSGKTFFEVMSVGTDKACCIEPLRAYASSISGKKVKVYACGDYENDAGMLQAADCGVCPANAEDKVKAVADYCLCDHTEGLIADLIEMLEREKSV